MKIKHLIFATSFGAMVIVQSANGTSIGGGITGPEIPGTITGNACEVASCDGSEQLVNRETLNCRSTSSMTCYKNKNTNKLYGVINCTSCNSGSKLVTLNNTNCPQALADNYDTYQSCYTICDVGYYNISSNGTCSRCPTYSGNYGTTAGTGATSITACYIPAGTYSDSTGTYKITESCYYK